jgi:hypothetical protein
MTIYNLQQLTEDADLEFQLRRSIQLAQERKEAMAKKKAAESKERASVSRERKIALALVAVLDQNVHDSTEAGTAEADARAVLKELGYASLESIPHRVAQLNDALKAALENGNGKRIAELGLELERAKAGKPPLVVKAEKVKAATGE